jgi:hypothetical protein
MRMCGMLLNCRLGMVGFTSNRRYTTNGVDMGKVIRLVILIGHPGAEGRTTGVCGWIYVISAIQLCPPGFEELLWHVMMKN